MGAPQSFEWEVVAKQRLVGQNGRWQVKRLVMGCNSQLMGQSSWWIESVGDTDSTYTSTTQSHVFAPGSRTILSLTSLSSSTTQISSPSDISHSTDFIGTRLLVNDLSHTLESTFFIFSQWWWGQFQQSQCYLCSCYTCQIEFKISSFMSSIHIIM